MSYSIFINLVLALSSVKRNRIRNMEIDRVTERGERKRERDTEFRVFWLDVLFINVCNIEGVFSNCAIPTWLTGENGFSKLWKQSTSTEYN